MDFRDIYKQKILLTQKTHGCINLLGSNTDYNYGKVLLALTHAFTQVDIAFSSNIKETNTFNFYSYNKPSKTYITRNLYDHRIQGNWTDYVIRALQELVKSVFPYNDKDLFELPSLNFYIHGTLPLGVGLASSASLVIAILKIIRNLYHLNNFSFSLSNHKTFLPKNFFIESVWSDIEIAKIGNRSEIQNIEEKFSGYANYLAVSMGSPGAAILIDCRTQDAPYIKHLNLFPYHQLMVVSTGVENTHELKQRHILRIKECKEAANLLRISNLSILEESEIHDIISRKELPEKLQNRVQHVVLENARVEYGIKALKKSNPQQLAELMNESHQSQSIMFQISSDHIDLMLERLISIVIVSEHSVFGARITGQWKGDLVVLLLEKNLIEVSWNLITQLYPKATWVQ